MASMGGPRMTPIANAGILRPGEAGYDEARQVWNAMVDRHPAMIARCRENRDVVAAISLARREGLEIGVRCGGHSVVGHAVPEGGLMVDLRPMGGVRVDPDRRRVWVQGGALLSALDAATAALRAGHDRRQHLTYRRRWPHPGRRDGLAGARARADLRQRDVVRGGHGERRRRTCIGRGERRAVLGVARRWRELRSGDRV